MTQHDLFDAPPPATPGRERAYFPESLLEDLRANPGKWGIGGESATTSQANYWRKQLKPQGFTIVTRKGDNGRHTYWITYRGETE